MFRRDRWGNPQDERYQEGAFFIFADKMSGQNAFKVFASFSHLLVCRTEIPIANVYLNKYK